MRLLVPWLSGALILCGARAASAQDGLGYPDWIRMKDSVAMRCRILSESDGKVEVIMSGGWGAGTTTIDRTQIEWLQRNSVPTKDGAVKRKRLPVSDGSQ